MRAVLFPRWLDSNRDRNFPFADSATLVNETGGVIPRGVFLDARVNMPGGGVRQFLQQLQVSSDRVRITIADDAGRTCRAYYVPGESGDVLELLDDDYRPAGVLVVDTERVQLLFSRGNDDVTFTPDQTELCAVCAVPLPENGVSSFLVNNEYAGGDVWLVGGPGVAVSVTPPPVDPALGRRRTAAEIIRAAAIDPNDPYAVTQIRIDAVGDPYDKLTQCLESTNVDGTPGKVKPARFVKSINRTEALRGEPDRHGNIAIVASSFNKYDNPVRVQPIANGIAVGIAGST